MIDTNNYHLNISELISPLTSHERLHSSKHRNRNNISFSRKDIDKSRQFIASGDDTAAESLFSPLSSNQNLAVDKSINIKELLTQFTSLVNNKVSSFNERLLSPNNDTRMRRSQNDFKKQITPKIDEILLIKGGRLVSGF